MWLSDAKHNIIPVECVRLHLDVKTKDAGENYVSLVFRSCTYPTAAQPKLTKVGHKTEIHQNDGSCLSSSVGDVDRPAWWSDFHFMANRDSAGSLHRLQ